MKKTFKILAVDPKELAHETGNYPIQEMVPFGPVFDDHEEAESWLEKEGVPNKSYLIIPVYTL